MNIKTVPLESSSAAHLSRRWENDATVCSYWPFRTNVSDWVSFGIVIVSNYGLLQKPVKRSKQSKHLDKKSTTKLSLLLGRTPQLMHEWTQTIQRPMEFRLWQFVADNVIVVLFINIKMLLENYCFTCNWRKWPQHKQANGIQSHRISFIYDGAKFKLFKVNCKFFSKMYTVYYTVKSKVWC